MEVVAEAEDPGARAALPRIADARLAAGAGRRTGPADSPHTEIPREGVRCERALTAATAGAEAPAAPQQPDAMHVAGEAGLEVEEAASRSTFAFAPEGDSTRAAAAAWDGRFPDQPVAKRAEFPRAVWPIPHNGDTRSSMAEHRGRTVGTPS